MSKTFSFSDLKKDCVVTEGVYEFGGQEGGRCLGAVVDVPSALYDTWPYNENAYSFLQQLRNEIFAFGLIEFPGLPVNKKNYTLAQKSPKEHGYSSNTYMTDFCQSPHQDTPPYPTAFWLPDWRQYSATWVMSESCCEDFYRYCNENPGIDIENIHRTLVPSSLENRTAVLVNHSPGLLLIDNSEAQRLYHARTVLFEPSDQNPNHSADTPMYAFNEPGLLHYINELDSRRGSEARDEAHAADVKAFMEQEKQSRMRGI